MASFIDDLADYLADQGIGTVTEDIFVGSLPDTPDACIAIFQNLGREPSRYIPTADPDFQILVRTEADKHNTAEAKCAAIVAILHQLANTELQTGGVYAYFIALRSEPFPLGPDSNGRQEWTINFVAKTKR